ncbi:flagellar hook capping FlgD N-terminal domain-containing protein [Trichococcus sp. K1Tr]|uniref:flagellar hook capping FlgD N-terminal domain-containing protein n=1 Tax=Trichococcus sp. K1Tr TaxID=3020847 RepID=UPI00232E48C7|nr:flagellar hook capping FlgD N-terminal domain-containing protein [Trichococcus sp. K1Tr]MDB6353467.1 flagellar hook capping FlgD N-terminal domain-containing protein [Trichococcus sp. K1Tr]
MDITPNFTIGSTEQLVSNKNQSNSDLSMDDFLQIMAAAIKMPAMSEEGGSSGGSTDFMAQMIQFSTMEQLKDLTESLNTTMLMTQQQQALAMIGKTVTVTGGTSIVTGVVDKVKFSNGFATLMIGGKDYYLNDIQSIGE